MKTQYDFYKSADFIGSKKDAKELLESYDDWELENTILVVEKSPRRFAVFFGESTFLVPTYELPTSAKIWLKNN